jgi:hypothetical protein
MAPQQWYVAQQTFNVELPDGGSLTVAKGSTWPAAHHAVKLDKDGVLFQPQDPVPAVKPKDTAPKAAG